MIKDKDRTLVAQDLITMCTKCKMELNHVVLFHNMKDFEKLAEKFKDKNPVPYSMSGSFKEDDVIDHTTFGIGFVESVSYQKMEVAFSGGPRVLVCNRQEVDLF
jgi:hypothetical protein